MYEPKAGDICAVKKTGILVKVVFITLSKHGREVAIVELLEPTPYCAKGDVVGYDVSSLTLLEPFLSEGN